jgi:5-methyltetrahydropteroyltriglutamate--homocysteine methyltransferase
MTHNLGYPRIGPQRELKRATEAVWSGRLDAAELNAVARRLRAARWRQQAAAGIDLIPSNDWSFYDHVLDTICLVGAIPARFGWDGAPLDLAGYFRLARGVAGTNRNEVLPLEMTKWFDTNYHYLVPELEQGMRFTLTSTKPVDEFMEAAALGIRTKPVLLGPLTFLLLAKVAADSRPFDRLALLSDLLPVYVEVLRRLAAAGADWVQLDEPVLALDLGREEQAALRLAYTTLAAAAPQLKLLLATYFGELRDNLPTVLDLPVHAVHVDAVRGAADLPAVADRLRPDMLLSIGIVDGRNIWKTDLDQALQLIKRLADRLGIERLLLAPSCSLLHVPISVQHETQLDEELAGWLAFADEKLGEVRTLADAAAGMAEPAVLAKQRRAVESRRRSARVHNTSVAERVAAVRPADYCRPAPFVERQALQQARLRLPLLPTTTIGSFPQTAEVRTMRASWRRGTIDAAAYEAFVEGAIDSLIAQQEALGLDMLVHGEFERNDMVEYFGEQLDGFAVTEHGWVQSYGTRYVKPPIIFGDVTRPYPMTVRWLSYAQGRTRRPVKGMLTGPVTLAKWSFVRDDQPLPTTVLQIALAIRDEVTDLERAGIAAIQIDEPALREGLPLRRSDRPAYLGWAVDTFRLTAAGAGAATQIHSHMCYAEFSDILDAIAALDVDVISIEAARSGMTLLQALADFQYSNAIGPGMYDIHSPHVPGVEEIAARLRRAAEVLPLDKLWANPDCGLKTRQWDEVVPALRNLVAAAQQLRETPP